MTTQNQNLVSSSDPGAHPALHKCNFFAPDNGGPCSLVGAGCFWLRGVCPKGATEGPRPEEGLLGAILFGEAGVDFKYEI